MPDAKRNASLGYVYAIVASVGLGTAVALSRAAYDGGTDPISVSTVRACFGAVLVGTICLATGRSLRVSRRYRSHLIWLGLLIGYMFYGNIGAVKYIPVGMAALLFFVYPPLVAIIISVLDQRRLGFWKTLALSVSFFGLALMLGVDLAAHDWRGIAIALAAGIGCAVNAVWIARVMRGMDMLVMTFYMTAIGGAGLVLASAGSGGLTMPTSNEGWLGALGVVVFQGCSIPFFYAAIPLIGPEKAAMLNNLQPVTSILLAYFLFAQALSVRPGTL